jgi:membrane protein
LVFTTGLAAIGKYISPYLPEAYLQLAGSAVSLSFVTLLFAMMFKWLPDTKIAWRDVWLGAALTAALFEMGKFLIGLYIGKLGLESTFGAAASLVILLIWVYYSSQIVLIGAEFTHIYATRCGSLRSNPACAQLSIQYPDNNPIVAIQAATRHSPYVAAMLALCAGWLVGRIRN